MHILITIAAVLVLTIGIYFGQKDKHTIPQTDSEVLSEQTQSQKNENNQNEPAENKDKEVDNLSDVDLSATVFITPVPTANIKNSDTNTYKYPNSSTLDSDKYLLVLQSNDNPDTITEWYKQKIQGSGLNVKTFIKTKANNKILNTLVGADSGKEIRVEIAKNPDDDFVHISVKITLR